MLLPIQENQRAGSDVGEAIIKTISSRVAGGRKELSIEAARVRPSHISISSCALCADAAVGYCRHAGVSLDAPIPFTCLKDDHYSCNTHCRGLYTDAGDMC
jgi:hypothetical protein